MTKPKFLKWAAVIIGSGLLIGGVVWIGVSAIFGVFTFVYA